MSDHAAAHADQHHHPNYVKIWAILVGLLAVSVFGPMLHIREITLIAAFGIALVKAYLVAKNFMHVNVEKPIVHYALGAALVLMVLLYAGVSPDAGRGSGQNWVKGAGWHHLGAPVAEHGAKGEKAKDAGEAGH